jgi:hypothetical protein
MMEITYPPNPSRLDIDFSNPEKATTSIDFLYHTLKASAATLNDIQEVTVNGFESPGNWPLVIAVFERLSRLKTVNWSNYKPIPTPILHALEIRSPSCRLYYTPNFQYRDPYNKTLETGHPAGVENDHKLRAKDRESILNSKNLHSLKADISYGSSENFEDLTLIFQILISCPNLRILDLKLYHEGCIVVRAPYAFDFSSSNDSKFPPLEVLKIDGYDFDERSDGGYSWYWKDMPSWDSRSDEDPRPRPVRKPDDGRTQLDCWREHMDWSHLHTLEIAGFEVEEVLKLKGDALPRLENLSIKLKDTHFSNLAAQFLNSTHSSLKSLSLHIWGEKSQEMIPIDAIVSIIISKHSSRLKYLFLRQEENAPLLNQAQITRIMSRCRHLESIDISLPRPVSGWNYGQYQPFILSNTLANLTFRFPTPDTSFDSADNYSAIRQLYLSTGAAGDEMDPMINKASVENLFVELRRRREDLIMERNSMIAEEFENLHPPAYCAQCIDISDIKRLRVYVGNWDARREAYMIARDMQRVAFWECYVKGFDEVICEGEQTRNVE